MTWKNAQYKLTSLAQLVMHNGQLADPTNRWAKSLKQITSKRNKTDADYEEMARIEFLGGLYLSEDGPIIPAHAIESTLVNAAKKRKEGVIAKSGMFCDAHARLEYDGPRIAEELWKDGGFKASNLVRVDRARVMRTRPCFKEWSTVISVTYDDEQLNLATLDEWVKIAGSIIGLLEWRPKFGRFERERIS
jgi:hypothetical protein